MITGMPRIAIAVNDFSKTVATFREQLGMPVVDISETTVQSLGAKLAMCVPEGGSNIELMSPADPEAPLSQSLQRFLDHRGVSLPDQCHRYFRGGPRPGGQSLLPSQQRALMEAFNSLR